MGVLELGKIVITTSFKDYNCGLNGWMSFKPTVKGEKFVLIYLGTEKEDQECINTLVMDFLKNCTTGALQTALDAKPGPTVMKAVDFFQRGFRDAVDGGFIESHYEEFCKMVNNAINSED